MIVRGMHCEVNPITRASGAGPVAKAAYMDGESYRDERLDQNFKYTVGAERVLDRGILLPDGAPEEFRDPEKLWNAVEAHEDKWAEHYYRNHPDKAAKIEHHARTARLAFSGEFDLANELGRDRAWEIAQEFGQRLAEKYGIAVQLSLHDSKGYNGDSDQYHNLHFHWQATARAIKPDGQFGSYAKFTQRQKDYAAFPTECREWLAERQNAELARMGVEKRIDPRSLKERGINIPSLVHRGPTVNAIAERGARSSVSALEREQKTAARAALEKDPWQVAHFLTEGRATWTDADLTREIQRLTNGDDAFYARTKAAILEDSRLVIAGTDARGNTRYTTKEYATKEAAMYDRAAIMAKRAGHRGNADRIARTITEREARQPWKFSQEQKDALRGLVESGDVACLEGKAGTGKTTILELYRREMEAAGYKVRGAALANVAADNLSKEAGIESRSLGYYAEIWKHRAEAEKLAAAGDRKAAAYLKSTAHAELTKDTVFVIDEAGMVDVRTLAGVIDRAHAKGAKVVLVGDPDQLAAIGAGDAMRGFIERHGAIQLTEIRRQKDAGDRAASEAFARSDIRAGLKHYDQKGRISFAENRDGAKADLVSRYMRDSAERPKSSRFVIARTNADVDDLNTRIRAARIDRGDIDQGTAVRTHAGQKSFSVGDRILFLENNKDVGVFNGSRGTVESIAVAQQAGKEPTVLFSVRLDNGKTVDFDSATYQKIAHGYAATNHKGQGQTIDEVYVLADKGMRRDAAYVFATRHRNELQIFAGRDDFANVAGMVEQLSKAQGKDLAADYQDKPTQNVRAYVEAAKEAAEMWRPIEEKLANEEEPTPAEKAAFAEAKERREEAAKVIVGDWKSHQYQARNAGMSRERLEYHAGQRDREPTEAEIAAAARVVALNDKIAGARDLWNDIKATHPGARSRQHPRFEEYAKVREDRDALAAEIHAERRTHWRAMKEAKIPAASVKAMAEAHAERVAAAEMPAAERTARERLARFLEERGALAQEERRIRQDARAAGQKAEQRPEWVAAQQRRAELDREAAGINQDPNPAMRPALEERGASVARDVANAADRHAARVLVASYRSAAEKGDQEARAAAAATLRQQIEEEAAAGRKTTAQAAKEAGITPKALRDEDRATQRRKEWADLSAAWERNRKECGDAVATFGTIRPELRAERSALADRISADFRAEAKTAGIAADVTRHTSQQQARGREATKDRGISR